MRYEEYQRHAVAAPVRHLLFLHLLTSLYEKYNASKRLLSNVTNQIHHLDRTMAKSGKYDAVICLGAVIRGSTSHYDYVCNEVSKGIASVSLESGIPVMFGVLTTENIEQLISPSIAPPSSFDVINSLKRAATMPIFIPSDTNFPSVKGELGDGKDILCRVHSECLTGDTFGSLRCDCGQQFAAAMTQIEREGRGILLYMRQEGRGT